MLCFNIISSIYLYVYFFMLVEFISALTLPEEKNAGMNSLLLKRQYTFFTLVILNLLNTFSHQIRDKNKLNKIINIFLLTSRRLWPKNLLH